VLIVLEDAIIHYLSQQRTVTTFGRKGFGAVIEGQHLPGAGESHIRAEPGATLLLETRYNMAHWADLGWRSAPIDYFIDCPQDNTMDDCIDTEAVENPIWRKDASYTSKIISTTAF
jgi:hypothetical protein